MATDNVTRLPEKPFPEETEIEAATGHVESASRLVHICTAAAKSPQDDVAADIAETPGCEVVTELIEVLELLGKEPAG